MGKINLENSADFSLIRAERQSGDFKKSDQTTQLFETKRPENADKLEISERATKVGKLVEQLKELPDVRREKVNSLREQIASGTYNPSSEKIADAILKDEKI